MTDPLMARVFDWVTKHPHKSRAFGGETNDVTIVLGITELLRKGSRIAVMEDELGEQVEGLIVYTIKAEEKELYIHHLLASPVGFSALRNAWAIYFPDYRVTGRRSRSGKAVAHVLSDFS